MPPNTRWIFPDPPPPGVETLARELGLSVPVASVLWQRGYRDPSSARRFLRPCLEDLYNPESLRDMEAAAARILQAVERRERILLYGDYDVDGTTSIAILVSTLRMLGASPAYHIPHRLRDGYGIHAEVIEREAALGTKLIISVDTGIRAGTEVALATHLGIDMVITDHHLPEANLPPALAVLNPSRQDSGYPERVLCGAGVTLKLVQSLLARAGWSAEKRDRVVLSLMKLVAIGTIADVVPLTGENRILAWHGLQGLRETRSPGLAALLRVAGFQPGELPTAGQIAFRVAPRMNAAGRMADAGEVVEMLLTQDAIRAQAIASALNELNSERQAAEQRIVQTITESCASKPPGDTDVALVFHGVGWHRGVVGIVASRMVERFGRPAFVLGVDPETGIAQGSGRSIHGFSLVDALETMPSLFVRFGGHHMAAGVTLPAENVPEFAERLNSLARTRLRPEDLAPSLFLDAVLSPDDLQEKTAHEVESLGPFGLGNPTPVFCVREAEIAEAPAVFAERHLRIRARMDGRFFRLTAWQFAERRQEFPPGRLMDLALNLHLDPRSAERGYPGWVLNLKEARASV
ncbi:MAG: single-stranded-DNA-specific exonuclease RecJ [Bryobacterales bacterium]|nr:single-stranded-DNA-specific exonuclease RecJ [Bryobacterales bacterium]